MAWTSAPSHAGPPIRQALGEAGRVAGLSEAGAARLVIVVDQLEELFTQDQLPAPEREAFVMALQALAHSELVWIVATMRSDFFDRLETLPALAALSAGEGRYLLLPPDEAEIGQIIRRPAREDSDGHHSGDAIELCLEPRGVFEGESAHVENVIAVVGGEAAPPLRAASEPDEMARDQRRRRLHIHGHDRIRRDVARPAEIFEQRGTHQRFDHDCR